MYVTLNDMDALDKSKHQLLQWFVQGDKELLNKW